jgi:hypothetical protein
MEQRYHKIVQNKSLQSVIYRIIVTFNTVTWSSQKEIRAKSEHLKRNCTVGATRWDKSKKDIFLRRKYK